MKKKASGLGSAFANAAEDVSYGRLLQVTSGLFSYRISAAGWVERSPTSLERLIGFAALYLSYHAMVKRF